MAQISGPEYHATRLLQEVQAAISATDRAAANVHRTLANLYCRKLASCLEPATDYLTVKYRGRVDGASCNPRECLHFAVEDNRVSEHETLIGIATDLSETLAMADVAGFPLVAATIAQALTVTEMAMADVLTCTDQAGSRR